MIIFLKMSYVFYHENINFIFKIPVHVVSVNISSGHLNVTYLGRTVTLSNMSHERAVLQAMLLRPCNTGQFSGNKIASNFRRATSGQLLLTQFPCHIRQFKCNAHAIKIARILAIKPGTGYNSRGTLRILIFITGCLPSSHLRRPIDGFRPKCT